MIEGVQHELFSNVQPTCATVKQDPRTDLVSESDASKLNKPYLALIYNRR
jgi:hypothetical protein